MSASSLPQLRFCSLPAAELAQLAVLHQREALLIKELAEILGRRAEIRESLLERSAHKKPGARRLRIIPLPERRPGDMMPAKGNRL